MRNCIPKQIVLLLFIIVLLGACKKKDKVAICTLDFRMVTIRVGGGELDNFYTIIKATGDTLQYRNRYIHPAEDDLSSYVVITDNERKLFEGRQEEFVFYGYMEGELVVQESFMIRADECHIHYVSGNREVFITP